MYNHGTVLTEIYIYLAKTFNTSNVPCLSWGIPSLGNPLANAAIYNIC